MKRIAALLLLATAAYAQPLPPAIPWDGKSRELIAAADDPWITPAEKSGFRLTPSYDDTVAWLRKLAAAAPQLRMVSLGKSGENRDIWMVVASKDRAFTPEALKKNAKPIFLAQAGIHAGEIDGKDAGLMLLRDMTVGKRRELLDGANFLFVPIFNVDGHERISTHGRVNQRGPEQMGWRTNAQNLNLNRDYAKLDTPEVRAMVAAIDRWSPDLFFDLHVTDGADYQYDVTWGWNHRTNYSPSISKWMDENLHPAMVRDLTAWGHIPGPLVFGVVDDDLSQGIVFGESTARFSDGYADVRHVGNALIENHSLKPYEQRVLGIRVLLETVLATLGAKGSGLRSAVEEDRRRRNSEVIVAWADVKKGIASGRTFDIKGVESKTTLSPISGAPQIEYLGRPVTLKLPMYLDFSITAKVPRARAYWIPAPWGDIADRVRRHGIAIEQINEPRELNVDMYRLVDPKLKTEAFEGHVQLETRARTEQRKERFPAGSWRISTDQPLGDLVAVLLEPESPDSFLQWGFFHSILQRTEYIESYVVEPLAAKMMRDDPKLAEEFRLKVATDDAFRADSKARLRWFYERSPYLDERWLLYPVARER